MFCEIPSTILMMLFDKSNAFDIVNCHGRNMTTVVTNTVPVDILSPSLGPLLLWNGHHRSECVHVVWGHTHLLHNNTGEERNRRYLHYSYCRPIYMYSINITSRKTLPDDALGCCDGVEALIKGTNTEGLVFVVNVPLHGNGSSGCPRLMSPREVLYLKLKQK